MQEISSKFESIIATLNTKYGFNLEANESLEINLDFKNNSLPLNPGKKGDRQGSGELTLYWNDDYNCWLPKDYFNATAKNLGESKLNPIDEKNKKAILEKISELKSELELFSFVKDISKDFENFYPKDLLKIRKNINELENEKQNIEKDKETNKKRLVIERDKKTIEEYKKDIAKQDKDIEDIEKKIEDQKKDFKKIQDDREKNEKEIIKKFNGFSSSIKNLVKDYNDLINFFEKKQGKEEAKKFKRLILRLDDLKELYAEIEETSSPILEPKLDPLKNKLNQDDILFIKSIFKDNPDINKIKFENKIKNNFNEKLVEDILKDFNNYKKDSIEKEYVPELDNSKRNLTKEDLEYLERLIRKKPDMSRGDFFKIIKNNFSKYLLNIMEVAWGIKVDPKRSEAVNFYLSFIKNYNDSKFLDKIKNNLILNKEFKENRSETTREIPDLKPILNPIYKFLRDSEKVMDKKEYEDSFLGFTEKFLLAVEDYASSGQQFAEVDSIIATIFTGINLNSKEGLVKIWKEAKIPGISKRIEDLPLKLSDILEFKEFSVRVDKDFFKDDASIETREDLERSNLKYKDLHDMVINKLDDIKNAPRFIKEFKNLAKNIPEFIYVKKKDQSTSTTRALNEKDLEISKKVQKNIKVEEFKKTIPEKSFDEINLDRFVFNQKKIEKDSEKLMKMLYESGDENQIIERNKLINEWNKKNEDIKEFNNEKDKLNKEKKELKNLTNKLYNEDVFNSLTNTVKNLEKSLEKETDPARIKKMTDELNISRKKLKEVTEDQKEKSEEIQKKIKVLNEKLQTLNEKLDVNKKEKRSLNKQKNIVEKNYEMYEGLAKWSDAMAQKAIEAKNYARSISVQRKNIEKNIKDLEKEIKENKKKIKNNENDEGAEISLKEKNKLKENELKFLKEAIEELDYFVTADGDVVGLSEKIQKEYLEKNLKQLVESVLKKFPDIMYKWVKKPETIKRIEEIEKEINKIKDKKEKDEKDEKEIDKFEEEIEKLEKYGIEKVKVTLEESKKRIEELREYFLTTQVVNGQTYDPKISFITVENYLDYLKEFDEKLKKIDALAEEGIRRDKYLKEIYIIPNHMDLGTVEELVVKEKKDLEEKIEKNKKEIEKNKNNEKVLKDLKDIEEDLVDKLNSLPSAVNKEDIKNKKIENIRPLSIFRNDSATSKDKKTPRYESTLVTSQLYKNMKDLDKIKSQYENYHKLFKIDEKGENKKWENLFKKINNTRKNFSDLLDSLSNNSILDLSEKEKDLSIDQKEKIWKNKRDDFLIKLNESIIDFKKIENEDFKGLLKEDSDDIAESFKKLNNLNKRSFDVYSYLRNYPYEEFLPSEEEFKKLKEFDYKLKISEEEFKELKISEKEFKELKKVLSDINDKKFKNFSEIKEFIESEKYSFKDSKNKKLENFLEQLEDYIKIHHTVKTSYLKKKEKEDEDERKKMNKPDYLWKNLKPSFGIKAGSVLLKTENSILYKIEKLSYMFKDPFVKLELESISNKLKEII